MGAVLSAVRRIGQDAYGYLTTRVLEPVPVYRLYHVLELWDWFASNGDVAHLAGLAGDIRTLGDLETSS